MINSEPIVFVEPWARGFRLDVLARAISAVRERWTRPIIVVTRADFASSELVRSVEPHWTNVRFVGAPITFGAQSASLSDVRFASVLLETVARVLRADQAADLVFLGPDEYLDALPGQWHSFSRRLQRVRPFVLLHNTEDLVAERLVGGDAAQLGWRAISAIESMDATLLAFDPRLGDQGGKAGVRIGARAVRVLPDPWHGEFACERRVRVRASLGLPPTGMLLAAEVDSLLDGCEPSWLAVAQRFTQARHVYLAVQGSVQALKHPVVRQLVRSLGSRVIHASPFAGSRRDVALIAATDLMLNYCMSAEQGHDVREAVATRTRVSAVRRLRAGALGAAFDRDMARMLCSAFDALHVFSQDRLLLLRDELDRVTQTRALRAFGVHLRAALRREAFSAR
jgi:hypothetical protein